MSADPVVQACGLTRRFGERTAVDNVDLTVRSGEILGVLGPNGAGKTTTIRMLAGIIAPSAGHAVVAGVRADRDPEALHERIGLLTETPGFYDRLSALANLRFFASLYSGNLEVERQAARYLQLMGLWQRRDDRVGTFSKGMKQRLALVRALVHEPDVLFLDEPTAGLDPEAALEVRAIIADLSRQGRSILLCTHLLAEAEELCHRISVLSTRLLAAGTPEELRRRLFRRLTVVTLADDGALPGNVAAALNLLPWVRSVVVEEGDLTVEFRDPEITASCLVQAVIDAGGRITSVSE
ncbi:MAG: ABC transporter ATP-binding protein [Gaiellales bacterium]|nr:ABC transporter ATP-binding protein [Gaiellales bacterium]